jgi:hypothetical protein
MLFFLVLVIRFRVLKTGGKFAVAGLKIAGASENFVLNY